MVRTIGPHLYGRQKSLLLFYWLADESGPISGQVVTSSNTPFIRRNPQKDSTTIPVKNNYAELAVFPKAFMQALCEDGTMKVPNGSGLPANSISMGWNGMQGFFWKWTTNAIGLCFAGKWRTRERLYP